MQWLHKGSSFQSVGKPIAVISIVGDFSIRCFNLFLKLFISLLKNIKRGIYRSPLNFSLHLGCYQGRERDWSIFVGCSSVHYFSLAKAQRNDKGKSYFKTIVESWSLVVLSHIFSHSLLFYICLKIIFIKKQVGIKVFFYDHKSINYL